MNEGRKLIVKYPHVSIYLSLALISVSMFQNDQRTCKFSKSSSSHWILIHATSFFPPINMYFYSKYFAKVRNNSFPNFESNSKLHHQLASHWWLVLFGKRQSLDSTQYSDVIWTHLCPLTLIRLSVVSSSLKWHELTLSNNGVRSPHRSAKSCTKSLFHFCKLLAVELKRWTGKGYGRYDIHAT